MADQLTKFGALPELSKAGMPVPSMVDIQGPPPITAVAYRDAEDAFSKPKLYTHFVHTPFPFDTNIWRGVYQTWVNKIRDYDSTHPRGYFDIYPSLDFSSGATTVENITAALVFEVMTAFYQLHTTVGMVANWVAWLKMMGFPIARRAKSTLKWSKLNTLCSRLLDVPMNTQWVDYMISTLKVLVFQAGPDNVESHSYPILLDPHDGCMEWVKGPLGATTRLVFPTTSGSSKRLPTLAEMNDTNTQFNNTTEAADTLAARSDVGNSGLIIAWLDNRVQMMIDGLMSDYPALLDASSPFRAVFEQMTESMGRFSLPDISDRVRANAPADGPAFVDRYMTWGRYPQAFYNPAGFDDTWDLGVDRNSGDFTYADLTRPFSDRVSIQETVRDGFQGFGPRALTGDYAVSSSFPDHQARLNGNFSIWQIAWEDVATTPVWGEIFGDRYSVLGWHPTFTASPGTVAGEIPAKFGFTVNAVAASRIWQDTGIIQAVLTSWEALLTKNGMFYPTPNGIVDILADSPWPKLYINPNELDNGQGATYGYDSLVFRSAYRPFINTYDKFQCGLYLVISYDESGAWSDLMGTPTYVDADTSQGSTGAVWETLASSLQDVLLYVGDGVGLQPNEFFLRRDTQTSTDLYLDPSVTLGLFPFKPFTVTRGDMMRLGVVQHLSSMAYKLATLADTYEYDDFVEDMTLNFEDGGVDIPTGSSLAPVALSADATTWYPYLGYDRFAPHKSITVSAIPHFSSNFIQEMNAKKSISLDIGPISAAPATITSTTASYLDIKEMPNVGRKENTKSTSRGKASNPRRRRSQKPRFTPRAQGNVDARDVVPEEKTLLKEEGDESK